MNPKGNPATLKKFTSEYQPKRNGRKPNHLKQYIKDHNVSTADIRVILGGILTELKDVDKAKEKLLDQKTPFIVKLFLKPLLHEYSVNKTNVAAWLTEYGFGLAKQEIESKNLNANIDVNKMTDQERADLEREVMKQLISENTDLVKELLNEQKDNND